MKIRTLSTENGGRGMPNKETLALTEESYSKIISTILNGFDDLYGVHHYPNERIATALSLEANLGMRISDIMQMTMKKIVHDGQRYRLETIEQKTQKKRTFTVPNEIYIYIQNYALRNKIGEDELLFPITDRQVQKHLKLAADTLGYPSVSTHSFRKYFATSIYTESGYNIMLVKQLLQHSSVATTQRYVGIGSSELEGALSKHIKLVNG